MNSETYPYSGRIDDFRPAQYTAAMRFKIKALFKYLDKMPKTVIPVRVSLNLPGTTIGGYIFSHEVIYGIRILDIQT